MCYCNCPYENKDGDCTLLAEYPPDSYCKDEDFDPAERWEAAERLWDQRREEPDAPLLTIQGKEF